MLHWLARRFFMENNIFHLLCGITSILDMCYCIYPFRFISSFFLYGKKIPYVVTRDVCPSVRLSCRLSVRRLWKYLWNAVLRDLQGRLT